MRQDLSRYFRPVYTRYGHAQNVCLVAIKQSFPVSVTLWHSIAFNLKETCISSVPSNFWKWKCGKFDILRKSQEFGLVWGSKFTSFWTGLLKTEKFREIYLFQWHPGVRWTQKARWLPEYPGVLTGIETSHEICSRKWHQWSCLL